MPKHEADKLIASIDWLQSMSDGGTAGNYGRSLRVTNELREHLWLWSIWPFDMTEEQMEEFKKEKARKRMKLARAKVKRELQTLRTTARKKPSARQAEPWKPLGISRPTFYRHKAKARADGKLVDLKQPEQPACEQQEVRRRACEVQKPAKGSETTPRAQRIYITPRTRPVSPQQGIQQGQAAALARIDDTEPGMM